MRRPRPSHPPPRAAWRPAGRPAQTGATHMQSHYCVHKLHGQSALITPPSSTHSLRHTHKATPTTHTTATTHRQAATHNSYNPHINYCITLISAKTQKPATTHNSYKTETSHTTTHIPATAHTPATAHALSTAKSHIPVFKIQHTPAVKSPMFRESTFSYH